jgi:tetratricopeptide (TPR) repeat protein
MKVINKWTSLLMCLAGIVLFNTRLVAQDLNTALKFSLSERYEDADEVFQKVLKAQPNNGDAYFYYGENILKSYISDPYSNTMEEAVKSATSVFKKGIANDSLNPLNYIGIGMTVLLEKGDTTKADISFRKAEESLPKKVKKITDKDITTLIKLAQAQLYAKEPRFNKAIAYLEKAKEAKPKNPDIYTALGEVYEATGSSQAASQAVINYNKAVFLNDKLYVPLVKIGNLYMRSRNPEGARENFEKARQIDSTYAPTYRALGELYSLTGQDNWSVYNYKKFLELSGNNIPAKIQYVVSLFRSKKYKEAIEYIEDIQKFDQSRNYLNRIGAYSAFEMKQPDYPKALNFIETFFKNTTPEKTISSDYAYYGKTLIKLKDKDSTNMDKGFEKLKKAVEMDSSNVDLISEISMLAYVNKKYDVAIDMFNKKIAMGKASNTDKFYLGRCYSNMENYDKAVEVFNKIIDEDKNNIQVYTWKAKTLTDKDKDMKTGEAVPVYESIIQLASNDTSKYIKELDDSYYYLGSFYLNSSKPDYSKSESYYRKIFAIDPKNSALHARVWLSLGVVNQKRKNLYAARDCYNNSLKLDPNQESLKRVIKSLTDQINIDEVNRQLNQ